MIITITGDLGSGKTSVGKELAQILGYEFISTGMIFRKLGGSRGLDVLETTEFVKNNREIDDFIDTKLKEFDDDNSVIDSRMAWLFVKDSFKIYMEIAVDEAAKRILNANRETEKYSSLQDAITHIRERKEAEHARFKTLYGVDIGDHKNYDLVVNSSELSIKDVTRLIISEMNKRELKRRYLRI